MNKYSLAIKLLQLLDEFENDKLTNNVDLQSFINWISIKITDYGDNHMKSLVGDLDDIHVKKGEDPINLIAQLVVFLNRYAKFYTKDALKNTELQTVDEFGYLSILYTYPSLTKTELIYLNVQEKTSGTEVIKRLLRSELIHQFDDPDDKRSQRVALTEKGKTVLFEAFENMGNVSKIMSAGISYKEKQNLAYLLNKLAVFHHQICKPDKEIDLKKLVEEHFKEIDE